MNAEGKYYVVRDKALPEVLIKVVEAKKMLEADKHLSIREATDRTGISRSSFYKYKDDIFPFHDSLKGRTVTLAMQMMDEPGLLSDMLKIVAVYRANILTIHQSIPVNGIASVTLSIEVLEGTGDVDKMIRDIENYKDIYSVKILARK